LKKGGRRGRPRSPALACAAAAVASTAPAAACDAVAAVVVATAAVAVAPAVAAAAADVAPDVVAAELPPSASLLAVGRKVGVRCPRVPIARSAEGRKTKKKHTEKSHVTLGRAELTTKSSVELAIFVWQYLLIIGKLATRHSRTSQLNLGISQHQQLAHLALSSLGVFFLYFLWYLS
jgi:hypothetical protein